MERRNFIKGALMATGGLFLGGSAIHRLMDDKEDVNSSLPSTIEKIHQGAGKNVFILMSAGTRKGNTDRLTDAYIKGVVERGHTVTKVYLGSMRVEGCWGCGACQRQGHGCVVQDGMQDIYPLFEKCDVVVMASPLYFWTITARLKAFIERLYAISVEDKYPVKGTVLLMTSGDDRADTFKQPLQYFQVISDVLGKQPLGYYCAGGCTGCEDIGRYIDERHLDRVYKMGLELL